MSKEKVSIFWFRRDLRLHDNHGLSEALKGDYPVLPIFIFDKNILEGFNSIFNMISIGISLISGTYFGAILVKPRRTL